MPKKELKLPISDVVKLLSGKNPAKKKKKTIRKKKPVQAGSGAPQAVFMRYQPLSGPSGFSFQPSLVNPPNHQQFLQPPPQVVRPVKEAEKSMTININSNYDPDRRKVEVLSDSKGGVYGVDMNPFDIQPRISNRRAIEGPPPSLARSASSSSSSSSPFQPSRPASFLNPSIIQREVVPSAPFDPLRPGGRRTPPMLLPVEEIDAREREILDLYARAPDESEEERGRRLTQLTGRNPLTGELYQYARGGMIIKNYPINRGMGADPYM